MCLGSSSPKAPEPPPVLPAAPTTPTPSILSDNAASKDARRRARGRASGKGQTSTILSGSRGTEEAANIDTKTLLGS